MTRSADFYRDGHLWFRKALSQPDLEQLAASMALDQTSGARLALEQSRKDALAPVSRIIKSQWPHHRPVRLVSFDKSETVNWAVPWHQDRIIAVKNRAEMDGYSNWSKKGGVWHCEPPEAVLQDMLFVRVHLDPATAENGAMEIAVGSHAQGAIPAGKAEETANTYPHALTTAEAGDILVLSMLTLHRSKPSTTDAPRRTLRIDYAAVSLPEPLEWVA